MKVTHVSVAPSPGAKQAGRPSLTPELIAAAGARYSRNNEGLEAILTKIEGMDQDAAVDAIFKFIDYGHASIADMVPVTMFIDEVSIYGAEWLWSECNAGAGQESSTRYIPIVQSDNYSETLLIESVVAPDQLGIPSHLHDQFYKFCDASLRSYMKLVDMFKQHAADHPEVIKIPDGASDQMIARLNRNYALERARYYLPNACKTNLMIIQSAREWARVISIARSSRNKELNLLGEALLKELTLVAPRLVKHAAPTTAAAYAEGIEYDLVREQSARKLEFMDFDTENPIVDVRGLFASTSLPTLMSAMVEQSFAQRLNRYSVTKGFAAIETVAYRMVDIAFAEVRDANRHRRGFKHFVFTADSFYAPLAQLVSTRKDTKQDNLNHIRSQFETLLPVSMCGFTNNENYPPLVSPAVVGHAMVQNALRDDTQSGTYAYWTLMGHTGQFTHTTSLENLAYILELRTGPGAHFRYAEYYRAIYDELVALYGEKALANVKLGNAEPE